MPTAREEHAGNRSPADSISPQPLGDSDWKSSWRGGSFEEDLARPTAMQPRRWRFLGILDAARKLYLPICWNVRDFCCHRGSWCGVANPALPSRVAFPGKRAHEESTAGRGKECESDVPGAVH